MPATTPEYGVPYPVGTDPIDTAGDIQRLAESVAGHVGGLATRIGAEEVARASGDDALQANMDVQTQARITNDIHVTTWAGARFDLNAIEHSSVITTTDANGSATINFSHGPFTTEAYVVAANGDFNGMPVVISPYGIFNPVGFNVLVRDMVGTPMPGGYTIRVNYIAVSTR